MSIMELGALGEFVGSFLVLLTLVYLSIQVRQNNKMTRTNMRMAVSAAQVEALKILVEPRVAEVVSPLSVAESGFPEPGTPESSIVYAYVNVNLVALENQYHQAIEGVLDNVDTALRRMRTFATIHCIGICGANGSSATGVPKTSVRRWTRRSTKAKPRLETTLNRSARGRTCSPVGQRHRETMVLVGDGSGRCWSRCSDSSRTKRRWHHRRRYADAPRRPHPAQDSPGADRHP